MSEKIFVAFLCDGHGMETPGKRTPYIPELGRSIRENEFNSPVVKMLRKELERCGVMCFEVAPSDYDTPLRERTDFANKKYKELQNKYSKDNVNAIYVSIHFNAYDGTFKEPNPEGFSAHVYLGHKNKEAGRLARCILKYLQNGTRQVNRGVVEQNLHVTRETHMVAVLTENGFMDNPREALLMLDKGFQKEVAVEHAQGICEYFGIKYIPETTEIKGELYRVRKAWNDPKSQIGAFEIKENAIRLADKNKGYKVYDSKGQQIYPVAQDTPKPAPEPITKKYELIVDVGGYSTANDAKKKTNRKTTVKPGTYFIYKEHDGMLNVSKKEKVAGSWIDPADNVKKQTQPKPQPKAKTYTLVKDLAGYSTAYDAKNRKNRKTTVKKGTYYVFNESQGMINVTSKQGVPGSWINPNDNKVSNQTTNKPKEKYVVLPRTVSSWRVYSINKTPVKGNEKGFLNPKKFGGLEYKILGNPQAHVYTIQTKDFGVCNIYAHPNTGAQIITK